IDFEQSVRGSCIRIVKARKVINPRKMRTQFRHVFSWPAEMDILMISLGITSCIPVLPDAREHCGFSRAVLLYKLKIYGSNATNAAHLATWRTLSGKQVKKTFQ